MSDLEVLQGEIEGYVREYNKMFGVIKMRIVSARYSKRVRKLTGKATHTYIYDSGKFWVVPDRNGGHTVWIKDLPIPDGIVL